MRTAVACILTVLASFLWACGGSDPGEAPMVYPDIYVNPTIGSDVSGDGSYIHPFKTIKAAMANATSGKVVKAEAGTYSAGEDFPIRIKSGVALVGDETAKGTFTVIDGKGSYGTGSAAVLPEGNTLVAGLMIKTSDMADANSGAVFINATGVVVRNNTLTGSYWGLFSDAGPANVRVEGNLIKGNVNGVEVMFEGMDLGGGTVGSAGKNFICSNSTNDLKLSISDPAKTAFARFNYWDHSPPTTDTLATPGTDIYIKYPSGAAMDFFGNLTAPLVCP